MWTSASLYTRINLWFYICTVDLAGTHQLNHNVYYGCIPSDTRTIDVPLSWPILELFMAQIVVYCASKLVDGAVQTGLTATQLVKCIESSSSLRVTSYCSATLRFVISVLAQDQILTLSYACQTRLRANTTLPLLCHDQSI
jgi:hypothetical protein